MKKAKKNCQQNY